MSELKPVKIHIKPEEFIKRLSRFDKDGDGIFNEFGEISPIIIANDGKDKSATLFVTPEIQSLYQHYKSVQEGGVQLPSEPITLRGLVVDPNVKKLTPKMLKGLAQRFNRGHLIKLADLARLFPKARIVRKGDRMSSEIKPLIELASTVIKTKKYPQGVSLSEAHIDPSGDLIVSSMFADELRAAAPKIAQLHTNNVKRQEGDPICSDVSAFKDESCQPDSWPLDFETMLELGTIGIPTKRYAKSGGAYPELIQALIDGKNHRDSRLACIRDRNEKNQRDGILRIKLKDEKEIADLADYLNEAYTKYIRSKYKDSSFIAQDLIKLINDDVPLTETEKAYRLGIVEDYFEKRQIPSEIDTSGLGHFIYAGPELNESDRNQKLSEIMTALQKQMPGVQFSKEDLIFLERAFNVNPRQNLADKTRRALFALCDSSQTYLTYDPSSAANPAYANRVAEKPTLHAVARISPRDTEAVYFAYFHIDMSSWWPRGNSTKKTIDGYYDKPFKKRKDKPYQHQGECEPLYVKLKRDRVTEEWIANHFYLGAHFVAEIFDYAKLVKALDKERAERIFKLKERIPIAISYLSGGKTLLKVGSEKIEITGSGQMENGWKGTSGRLLGFEEVNVTEKGLRGDYPIGSEFLPEGDGAQNSYQLLIEGTDDLGNPTDDFAPTCFYAINGSSGNIFLNEHGYNFFRAAAEEGEYHGRENMSIPLYIEWLMENELLGLVDDFSVEKFGYSGIPPDWMTFSWRHRIDGPGLAMGRRVRYNLYSFFPDFWKRRPPQGGIDLTGKRDPETKVAGFNARGEMDIFSAGLGYNVIKYRDDKDTKAIHLFAFFNLALGVESFIDISLPNVASGIGLFAGFNLGLGLQRNEMIFSASVEGRLSGGLVLTNYTDPKRPSYTNPTRAFRDMNDFLDTWKAVLSISWVTPRKKKIQVQSR